MKLEELYARRKLAAGYPDLPRRALETFTATLERFSSPDDGPAIDRQLGYLGRILEGPIEDVLVLGCGPRPTMLRHLLARGAGPVRAIGVEPVPSFVRA